MEVEEKFLMPRSLIGRSLLLIAAIYLASEIVYTLSGALLIIPDIFRVVSDGSLVENIDMIWSQYCDSYAALDWFYGRIVLMAYYVVTMGTLWLMVFTAFRFARNPRFGVVEYRQIWIITATVTFVIPEIAEIITMAYEGISGYYLYTVLFVNPLNFLAVLWLIGMFFKKIPFGEDISWKGEISASDFVFDNIAAARQCAERFGIGKSLLVLSLVVGVYVLLKFLNFAVLF